MHTLTSTSRPCGSSCKSPGDCCQPRTAWGQSLTAGVLHLHCIPRVSPCSRAVLLPVHLRLPQPCEATWEHQGFPFAPCQSKTSMHCADPSPFSMFYCRNSEFRDSFHEFHKLRLLAPARRVGVTATFSCVFAHLQRRFRSSFAVSCKTRKACSRAFHCSQKQPTLAQRAYPLLTCNCAQKTHLASWGFGPR